MDLKSFKPVFDDYLHTRLSAKLSSVKDLFPGDVTYDLLTYLEPYVDHWKRFRPYMVYLWYTMNGGEDVEYALKVWLIHEIIHIFALIHDDICDQWTTRHGIATYHKHLATKYENPYHGDVQAMLVWDLVYTRALQEAQIYVSWEHAHKIIFDMLNEVVIGQMLDVEFSAQKKVRTEKEISNKDHLKSGQYTFQKPMMVWASLAGVKDLSAIQELGKNIWIAFQVRDDLLDRIPNKECKTIMSDIQEWNQTVVMSTCREVYDADALRSLESCRGRKLSVQEIATLQENFKSFAIQKIVQEKNDILLDTVEKQFNQLQVLPEYENYFQEIIIMLRGV